MFKLAQKKFLNKIQLETLMGYSDALYKGSYCKWRDGNLVFIANIATVYLTKEKLITNCSR